MNQPREIVKLGVIGVGVMGKNHARVATSNPKSKFVGVYDPNETAGLAVANQFDAAYYSDIDSMVNDCDAIVIASPTTTHFDIAKKVIQAKVHCLIEKPISVEVSEGEELIRLAEQNSVALQVGHVERYNPVYSELKKILEGEEVLAMRASRLSYNTTRANDVDVVLDLMIHDIDTVNALAGGVQVVSAIGESFRSASNDYVSAILKSESGTIIDITASKVSQTKQRVLSLSCANSFINVDYLRKEIDIVRHSASRYITEDESVQYRHESFLEKVFVPNVEPLMAEHLDFIGAILGGKNPLVDGHAGVSALKLAKEIQQCSTNS